MAYTTFTIKVDASQLNQEHVHYDLLEILSVIGQRLLRQDVEGRIHGGRLGEQIGAWSLDDDTNPTTPAIQKYL